MKVRLEITMSGTRNGEPWPRAGAEIELPDPEAADLCAAGLATPLRAEEKTEKAVKTEVSEKRGPTRPRKSREATKK